MTDDEAKRLKARLSGQVHACLWCNDWVAKSEMRTISGRGIEVLARCHGETSVQLFTEDDIRTPRFFWFARRAEVRDSTRREITVHVHHHFHLTGSTTNGNEEN